MYSLIIDIGNSFAKIAKSENGKISLIGKIRSNDQDIDDKLKKILSDINVNEVKNMCISSTRPETTPTFIEFAFYNDIPIVQINDLWWVNQRINQSQNTQIGQDLLAMSFYTSELSNGNCINITLGSATAITVIKNHKIAGVIIFPSINSAVKSLRLDISLITQGDVKPTNLKIGNTTDESISIGVVSGHVHQINGFIKDLKEEFKVDNVYITGGSYNYVKEGLNFKHNYDELLILKSIDSYCNTEPSLNEAICDAFKVNKNFELNPIEKGRTNNSWWFKHNDKKYVVRKSNPNKTYQDMQMEAKIFWKLKFEDITANPICISPKNQILITEFIEHENFTLSEKNIDEVCKTMNHLHNLEWTAEEFNPIEKIKLYDTIRIKHNFPENPHSKEFIDLAKELIYKYGKCTSPIHTDLSDENILINKENGKAYFIDWEYSGLGNPLYDAAVFCVRNDLSETQISRVAKNLNFEISSLYEWMFISSLLGMFWTYTKENWDAEWDSYHKLQFDRVIKYRNKI